MTNTERVRKWRRLNHKKWLAYSRQWSKENPESGKKSSKKRKLKTYTENSEKVFKLKQQPCQDCHIVYDPICMDFDHRDRRKKLAEVSRQVGKWSWKRLKTEIDKCDVVCSNCHRLRTWGLRVNPTHKETVQVVES